MPTDITISTDKPSYLTSGLVTASSGTYDAAVPTATAPSTTGQTFLVPTNLGDKPSLLRLVPFHSANSATTPSVRVIGWSTYNQTSGTPVYVPTLLFWLRDDSADGAATAAFLDRRLADVGRIGKLRGRIEARLGAGLGALRERMQPSAP